MAKEDLMGLNFSDENSETWETCVKGKTKWSPFSRHDELYTKKPLETIHIAVCEPFECETLVHDITQKKT